MSSEFKTHKKHPPESDEKVLLRDQLFNETENFWHVGHFAWNRIQKRFEVWSETFTTILDLPSAEVDDPAQLLELLQQRIHHDDLMRYRGLMAKADDFSDLNINFRVLNDAGQHSFLRQVGIKNIETDQGSQLALGALINVTAKMIEESDSKYADSLAVHSEQVVDIGNFIYDEIDDIYLYVSAGCAAIFGLTQMEFIESVNSAEDDLANVYEEDRERLNEAYVRYHRTGENCQSEYRTVRPDGEIRWIRELMVAQQTLPDGRVALSRGVVQDITDQKNIELELRAATRNLEDVVNERTRELAEAVEQLKNENSVRKQMAAELEFLANHDPLTGLPSLRLCHDRLERSFAESRRSEQMTAILFIDLDGFKQINDTYHHEFGDIVLKEIGGRILAGIREIDTAARIGGDEFLVILSRVAERSVIERIANTLINQISQPITVEGNHLQVGASIGIALYPEHSRDADELISLADKAMYSVKNSGKNGYRFHSAVS